MTYRALGLPPIAAAKPTAVSAAAARPLDVVFAAVQPWGSEFVRKNVFQDGRGWPASNRSFSARHAGLVQPESDFSLSSCDAVGGRQRPFCVGKNDYIRVLSDAGYAASAGAQALLYFKEQRMRRLLDELALSRDGFPNGLRALAYDASLVEPVTVPGSLVLAVKAAKSAFDAQFPKSRWSLVEWVFVCDSDMLKADRDSWISSLTTAFESALSIGTLVNQDASGNCPRGFTSKGIGLPGKCNPLDQLSLRRKRWQDPANAEQTCVGKAVLAAPTFCAPGSEIDLVYGPKSRRIPVWAAIRRVGRELAPTPWFAGFLNCILGTDWRSYGTAQVAATEKQIASGISAGRLKLRRNK